MVNVGAIESRLKHFGIIGTYYIDPKTGIVDVEGSVHYMGGGKQLGVQFGKVMGDFYCQNRKLTTLKGSPAWVERVFYCYNNQLTSLAHAPAHVGRGFSCDANLLTDLTLGPEYVGGTYSCSGNPLQSLEGISTQGLSRFVTDYTPRVPLLRSLYSQSIKFTKEQSLPTSFWPQINQVSFIMNKYAGQGKAGVIKCAAELAKAGFKENARW